jgi:hypothetical protein
MQLHEAKEIKEVFNVNEVNAALRDGWCIVAVVTSMIANEPGHGPYACYVMASYTTPRNVAQGGHS